VCVCVCVQPMSYVVCVCVCRVLSEAKIEMRDVLCGLLCVVFKWNYLGVA